MPMWSSGVRSGDRASQPSLNAKQAGTLYFVTDEDVLERWSGSAWSQVAINAAPALPAFVGVSLRSSGAQSLSDATSTALTLQTEVFDTDGFHASTNAYVTVPAGLGGTYLVNAFAEYAADNDGYRGLYVLSGTAPENWAHFASKAALHQQAVQGDSTRMSLTQVLVLDAAATVVLGGYQSAGNALNVNICTLSLIRLVAA
jgi:hypothetical protein